MPTFTRPIVHRCDANPDPERFVVRYNDYGVQLAAVPGVTRGCPFCWKDYLSMRRERFERYAKRAFVAKPHEVGPPVAEVVRRLERPGFPPTGICTHFGVYVNVRGLGINVMPEGPYLKVVMRQDHFPRPASLHRARANAVATALTTGIRQTWNGGDKHSGIAIVLNRPAPESLVSGIQNYHSMCSRVFDRTEADKKQWDAWQAWYDRPLEEVI